MQPYVEAFSRLPTLTTPRLILRPVRMSDAQDLYEYSRDPQVAQHVLWEAHRSIHQTRAYIRYLLRQYRNAAPGCKFRPANPAAGRPRRRNFPPGRRR